MYRELLTPTARLPGRPGRLTPAQDAAGVSGGAGGKTGTAQTGQYDENGEELLNYWFSGFYPADDPRYTITVLQDGILKPETSSAAIFAKVTEILAVWENS